MGLVVKIPLSAIADIRNGYQFRGRVQPVELTVGAVGRLPLGVVPVIQIKDIDADRRLQTDDLVLVKIDGDPAKYEARQGDVLFLARGHRLFATAITQPISGTIATGYFYILRPRMQNILPRYLAWYINQPPFQTVLRTFMKGTQQPLVSRKDIEDLEVQIPPLPVQEAIVELDDLEVVEQRLLAALQEKRSQLVQAISMQAAQRPA
jgi:hypothetical protein